jgi:hypothetical protein
MISQAPEADDGFLPDEAPLSSLLPSVPGPILQNMARQYLGIGFLCNFMRVSKLVCGAVAPLRMELPSA